MGRLWGTIKTAVSALIVSTLSLSAQEAAPTALISDRVRFDGTLLIATGSVEVFQEGNHLTASQVIYDNQSGALQIDGPIQLTDASGETVILGSSAELDQGLVNGIIQSARIVIADNLQAAGDQLDLKNGRYSTLRRAVVSSCNVCDETQTPFWDVQAKEIIHDREERQIYFKSALFRVASIPVLWTPRLRMPDPTLKRATGFLSARQTYNSLEGTGVALPFFLVIDDHRDLTLTPLLASKSTELDWRYRQAYVNGRLTSTGNISEDSTSVQGSYTHQYKNGTTTYSSSATQDITRSGLRSHAFIESDWDLGKGYALSANLRVTSDIDYLSSYGIFTGDRLPSDATLTKYTERSAFRAKATQLRSLRQSEAAIEDTLPFTLGELSYDQTIAPALPGRMTVGVNALGAYRRSDVDQDGYDYLRTSLYGDWHGHSVIGGLRVDGAARLEFDRYTTRQDSSILPEVFRTTPAGAVRLSYPLTRVTSAGAQQWVEPFVQLGWSDIYGGDIPNNDATRVELDEGNLFALARFPGADREATGLSSITGIRHVLSGQNWDSTVTVANIYFDRPQNEQGIVSDFNGENSNLLVGLDLISQGGLSLTSRALFNQRIDVTKVETRVALTKSKYSLSGVHSYVIEETLGGSSDTLDEYQLSGSYRPEPEWDLSASLRYNRTYDLLTTGKLSATYENECARFLLAVSRTRVRDSAIEPETTFTGEVSFGSFGAKRSNKACYG